MPISSATFSRDDQLLGHAHRIAGRAVVVARHDLELRPSTPPRGIDLVLRELHPFLYGSRKAGKTL